MKKLSINQKVKNQYGDVLTVKNVVGNSVYVFEEYNNTYHITKIFAIK